MTEKKLEKQHVEEINLIRTKFAENNTEIALATKEIYTLEQRALQIDSYRTQLLEQFQSLQQQESELIAKLKEHYGDGHIDLEKSVFIATSAIIDFFVDLSRSFVYFFNGYITKEILIYIPILVVISFIGTYIGKRILNHISQDNFKRISLILILLIGIATLIFVPFLLIGFELVQQQFVLVVFWICL